MKPMTDEEVMLAMTKVEIESERLARRREIIQAKCQHSSRVRIRYDFDSFEEEDQDDNTGQTIDVYEKKTTWYKCRLCCHIDIEKEVNKVRSYRLATREEIK